MEKKVETPTETALQQPVVMRSFSLEEMKQAFKAGQETIWEDLEQTTRCTKFESIIQNVPKKCFPTVQITIM